MPDKTEKLTDREALVDAFLRDPNLTGEPFWMTVLREIDPDAAARLKPGELPDLETMKQIIAERARQNREAVGNERPTEVLSIKVTPTLMRELTEFADTLDISRAEFVRRAIADALNRQHARDVDDYIAERRAALNTDNTDDER